MWKPYRALVLAVVVGGAVAALVVPVGFALSLEFDSQKLPAVSSAARASSDVISEMRIPLAGPSSEWKGPSVRRPVPDGAKLFFVGTLLLGLAAGMRRTL